MAATFAISVLLSGCDLLGVVNSSQDDQIEGPSNMSEPYNSAARDGAQEGDLSLANQDSREKRDFLKFQRALVNAGAGAGAGSGDIAEILAELSEAGFSSSAITHTALTTPTGLRPDSVSLALAYGDRCFIAQYSESWIVFGLVDSLNSVCLIGDTYAPSQIG